jgi:3-hydroxyisobutyrate dehydrogenase-like beta-hydroxyacid dehydrogenase
MTIAFLGTGLMGSGFVRGLLARGHEVAVWNRTADRARPLAAAGARLAASPAEAASGAERIYLSLSDDEAVDAVLAAALPASDAPIVDFTTTAPSPTRARAARLAATGRRFLHAPVFMAPENARLAQGLMLAAGPEDVFAAQRPELEAMTGRVWYLGAEPGRAAAFKLFGNAMFFAVVSGFADVLEVARAAGIAPPDVMELFAHLDPSRQIGFRGAKMVRGDFSPTFELKMARKDVRLAVETAGPDARLAILPAIAARMDELISRGHGADDLGVLAVDVTGRRGSPRTR